MGLADELARLEEMHARGALSDDEFQRAKARLLGTGPGPLFDGPAINRFRRSRGDRWLGGVCGGLAVVTGVDSWVWRLITAMLALLGGAGIVLYILLWILVPDE